jgi:hypothetical protein
MLPYGGADQHDCPGPLGKPIPILESGRDYQATVADVLADRRQA